MTNRGTSPTGSLDLMYLSRLVLADGAGRPMQQGELWSSRKLFESRLAEVLGRYDNPSVRCLDELSVIVQDAESHLDVGGRAFVKTYALCRQIEALFKKNVSLEGTSPESRASRAMEKFYQYEQKCSLTNQLWRATPGASFRGRPDLLKVIGIARQEVFKLLSSDIPDPSKIWDLCTFGPGQTFSSKTQEHANLYFKMAGPHSMTEGCQALLRDHPSFVGCFPMWTSSLVAEEVGYDVVLGNRVTTVAKTAVIDRTIAVEPSMNVFIQAGIGNFLARKLRKWGFDLTSQGRNRFLARKGSVTRAIATLDLEGASDTLAIEVVRFMLPSNWFELLSSVRSPAYQTDRHGSTDTWRTYEKFSSMGNGFTFPLETLIFGALCRAVAAVVGLSKKDNICVYGDDICVPTQMYALLAESLEALGFIVNQSKSFAFGPFRESCGTDFAFGDDVRPVYLRSNPTSEEQVYNLFNRLMFNRAGFSLPLALMYLHTLVQRPLYGPMHLPAGKDYEKWYAGKSTQWDGYFIAPSFMVERFRKWNPRTQNFEYRLQRLVKTKTKLRGKFNRTFRYLEFLYSGTSYEIDSKVVFRMERKPWTLPGYAEPALPWSTVWWMEFLGDLALPSPLQVSRQLPMIGFNPDQESIRLAFSVFRTEPGEIPG